MKKYTVKKAGGKGKGLFASKNIREGEVLFRVDLSKQKSYSLKEISKLPENDHADYAGRGRYVLSFHPYSYINHSCNPNIVVRHDSIAKSSFVALRDIARGEELTFDYGVNALDQIGKGTFVTQGNWIMRCKCGNKNCRKRIYADFFMQPIEIQRRYYRFLPPSIRRKYKERVRRIKMKSNQALKVCRKCKATCCKMGGSDFTENEMKKVLQAGHKNYFVKIDRDHYELKCKKLRCPYLARDNSCIIQDVKPPICKCWPVYPYFEGKKRKYYLVECPLTPYLSKKNISIMKKQASRIPRKLIETTFSKSKIPKFDLNLAKKKFEKFKKRELR